MRHKCWIFFEFFFHFRKDVSGFVIIRYFFVTDDSLIDESPLPMSILKKASTFRNKKLDASIANYSKVEISPGLFVKRPSSKTKMPPPAPLEPNTHQKSQAQQNIQSVHHSKLQIGGLARSGFLLIPSSILIAVKFGAIKQS